MSIENIRDKILRDAKDEAAALIEKAEKEAEEIRARGMAEAEELKKEYALRGERDCAVLKERRESVAGLEARKLILAAKQEMIESCFEGAVKKLSEMPEAEYLAFLSDRLSGYEDGELLLSARDRERIGEKLLSRLEGKNIALSAETADIAGGFILRKGDVSVNASFEALLEEEKKGLTSQLAETLFS